MDVPVKAIEMSRQINAPEWAVRVAMGLADRHLHDVTFEKRAAFVADAAEVIVSYTRAM